MNGKNIINKFLIGATFIGCSLTALAQEEPLPGSVQIKSVNYNGSGCPANTVGQYLSDDNLALTLIFDEFSVNGGTSANGRRHGPPPAKACNVRITFEIPDGWTFGLFYADIRGYADLDENARGIQRTTYSFSRSGEREVSKIQLEGPFSDDFANLSEVSLDNIFWSPCQTRAPVLNINASLQVRTQRNAQGSMTIDTIDGEVAQQYGIVWKKCNNRDDRQWRRRAENRMRHHRDNHRKPPHHGHGHDNGRGNGRDNGRGNGRGHH